MKGSPTSQNLDVSPSTSVVSNCSGVIVLTAPMECKDQYLKSETIRPNSSNN